MAKPISRKELQIRIKAEALTGLIERGLRQAGIRASDWDKA